MAKEIRSVNPANSQEQVTFTKLKPNTQYRISMMTIKEGKSSTPIQKMVNTKEVQNMPKPPVELRFSEISSRSLHIAWKNNPNSGRRPFPDQWQILYRKEGEEVDRHEINGGLTSFQLRNLEPLTTYTIEIRAIDNHVQSEPLLGNVLTADVAPRQFQVYYRSNWWKSELLLSIGRSNQFNSGRALLGR